MECVLVIRSRYAVAEHAVPLCASSKFQWHVDPLRSYKLPINKGPDVHFLVLFGICVVAKSKMSPLRSKRFIECSGPTVDEGYRGKRESEI